ncbi:lytic transglycosylase domain-containing protein [Ahrensia sp. 13_GOM-1096m]|uniref:lytic transglycosylase domain-containing protein n=1 Tax=Ahrensia sp. 13_GOM-1096m TaxID=1380380 RepID=UPI001FFFB12B|nr:lytic transglycosylase domain-containing protein [Ahrensia sp. 13_GOM-1096m]
MIHAVLLKRAPLLLSAWLTITPAFGQTAAKDIEAEFPVERICQLIAREASSNGMPLAFFARLIWKESRFDAKAVSPVGAQGIAQFMPGTAKIRNLDDPFDPEKAIPASALYLAKLRVQFGNLGLASAAYNSGETRVANWLARGGSLPIETENYVLDITGEPVDTFFDRRRQIKDHPLEEEIGFFEACLRLPIIETRAGSMAARLTMPWAIQVAGNFKREVAQRSWSRIKARNGAILMGMPLSISRSRSALGRRGIYTVRLGAPSRQKANAICGRLRSNGTPCIVQKN